MGRRIAAFDFDGTLTRGDTVLPFLVQACGRTNVSRALARVAPAAGRARLPRRPPGAAHHRDLTKELLLRELFRGHDAASLAEQGEHYASTLRSQLRPQMAEQVRWHRVAGHELVIVSASLAVYLVPFARAHGFDHAIGVELEAAPDGRLTGLLTRPNVRGAEKVTRLRAWLEGTEPEKLWAYGNSRGDQELLSMATHPVWVDRRNMRASRSPA